MVPERTHATSRCLSTYEPSRLPRSQCFLIALARAMAWDNRPGGRTHRRKQGGWRSRSAGGALPLLSIRRGGIAFAATHPSSCPYPFQPATLRCTLRRPPRCAERPLTGGLMAHRCDGHRRHHASSPATTVCDRQVLGARRQAQGLGPRCYGYPGQGRHSTWYEILWRGAERGGEEKGGRHRATRSMACA